MKSKDLRKKNLSNFSSQDELAKERVLNHEKPKRSKKPSIYDDLEDDLDDFYASKYEDDFVDEFEDDDYLEEDEDIRY